MKIFRVVTQRDGNTVKAPGISETELKQVDRRYAADTMQRVWDEIEAIRNDPEEDLIAIIEEHPAITVLGPNAKVSGAGTASAGLPGYAPANNGE
jgi:hypothetical protein